MEPVSVVVIGAGNRGRFTFGRYALQNPQRMRVVAIAEPVAERREAMAREHALEPAQCAPDWRELLARGRLADAAIVATSDTLHTQPALAAIAQGYHVLLEKPIAPRLADCVRVVEAAEAAGRILQIGHVLRYTGFYAKVAELLQAGALGELVHLDLREHVAAWHMTHSFVRGKFRSRAVAAPILLAKACHDLDLLAWFAGAKATQVASFGGRAHYRAESAPHGAPERCSDGCPVQASCAHDAVKFYAGPEERIARHWPWTDVSLDPSREARMAALASGPYGRCVYRCDNDVLDHQQLALCFENGVSASFALHGFAAEEKRTLRITGTRGELRGVFQEGVLELTRPGVFGAERILLPANAEGHYGGDAGLLHHFTEVVAAGDPSRVRASGRSALESHWIGFAAERARETSTLVELSALRGDPTRLDARS